MKASRFLIAVVLLAGVSHSETFREVLQQKKIPLNAFSEPELAATVASGLTADMGNTVALVYPTRSEADTPGPPLHVVVYDRSAEKLTRRLIFSSQRASDPQAEISDVCFGPVLGLSEQDGNLLFTTRIDPSAGCTVVLNPELWVSQTVMGWPMAKLGASRALVEEDMVHAAAIHSGRLEILDLLTGKLQEVYPPEPDPLRLKFSRELRQHATADSPCVSCNPKLFNDDVSGPVSSNVTGSAFAFVATFDAKGFGEKAEQEVGKRSVLYVYRRQLDGWYFCEQEVSDLELQAVKSAVKGDLEDVAQRCNAVRPVKVAPLESPFAKYEKSKE